MINFKDNKALFFLFFIISIYVFLFFINKNSFVLAIKKVLYIFSEIYYVFIIIFLLMVSIDYFLKTEKIKKYLGNKSGIKGWLISIVGGIISSGPIYMWYPLLKDLKKQGVRNAYIFAFLYNRSIKIPLLPIIFVYFGVKYTIVLMIVMIFMSIIQGIILERILINEVKI